MNPAACPTFDNSYARLPEKFYTRQLPVPVSTPGLIRVNHPLAKHLGFNPDWLESEKGIEFAAGNFIPEGAEPIATVYAGHQFGGWNPQLGDGRAILLGEVIAGDNLRYDIQLKGSGRTLYSRGGDGRAPVGPVLREYIVSEAMAVLGVPTTRSLAAVTTGEDVLREGRLPGAVLTRVAQSHIRIGTFQFFASRQDQDALRVLVDHVIQRHYPETAQADNPLKAMLDGVVARQANLIAQWQLLGFIHGVMNTDNMLLSGETVDYGPCAFMDQFDPDTVFSSIDHGGRYAYGRQPQIAQWNLARFAETLLPLIHEDPQEAVSMASEAISGFSDNFRHYWLAGMRAKLGLLNQEADDSRLVDDLLDCMHRHGADFTNTFRDLASGSLPEASMFQVLDFKQWFERWQARLKRQPDSWEAARQLMHTHNPAVIPRNHRVEKALEAAAEQADFTVMEKLLSIVSQPYQDPPEQAGYHLPPPPSAQPYRTFCGT